MPQKLIEFSAHVPEDEYRTFKQNFPQYGAVKWFINMALRQFNEECRAHPSNVELGAAAIQRGLDLEREANAAVAASGQ